MNVFYFRLAVVYSSAQLELELGIGAVEDNEPNAQELGECSLSVRCVWIQRISYGTLFDTFQFFLYMKTLEKR